MKWVIIMVVMVVGISCQHDPDPWTDNNAKKEMAVYVRAGDGVSSLSFSSDFELFMYNAQTGETGFYEIGGEGELGNQFKLGLLPGDYAGYCVMNAQDESVREYDKSKTPEQIFIKLKKSGEVYLEAGDYFLGHRDFTVTEEGGEPIIFDLERKVAQLRVIVENVPPDLTDLTVQVSAIPEKMDLLGTYTEDRSTVVKTAATPISGISTTSLLLFPVTQVCGLSLSYKVGNMLYVTPSHPITTLTANRITEVKAIFAVSGDLKKIDFQTNIRDWESEVFYEDDWYIDQPEEVCKGEGNGVNLLKNGGFEEGETEGLPHEWKFDAGGADKKMTIVSEPVRAGTKAVRLEGKTYLYQDVMVTAGMCYQLKLFVNSLSPDVKWRYWCTWMAGSQTLPSDEIRISAYQYQTEGYTDVFGASVFRAPLGATKLRMEIRTYTTVGTAGIGLYVDDVDVERVE